MSGDRTTNGGPPARRAPLVPASPRVIRFYRTPSVGPPAGTSTNLLWLYGLAYNLSSDRPLYVLLSTRAIVGVSRSDRTCRRERNPMVLRRISATIEYRTDPKQSVRTRCGI